MEDNRYKYLKSKQHEFHESFKIQSKHKNLNSFISLVQKQFNVKITEASFPLSEIVSPVRYDLPEEPKYTKFIIDTNETEIIQLIKDWFAEQKSETFLIKNVNLINRDDWLEIDSQSLLENFNHAFIKFDLLHTLIFSPSSKNFINVFEFENEVIFYKGNISDKEIRYYC